MNFIETIDEHIRYQTDRSLLREMHGTREVGTNNRTLMEWINRGRGTLRARGVGKGDRVAVLSPNSARWVAADLAVLHEGAVMVPMYARQEPKELVEMMHDCGAMLVVCADTKLEAAVKAHWADAPTVVFDAFFQGEPISDKPAPREPRDPVTIIYTSGTSGAPKGVVLSVENVDFMLPVTRDALGRLMGARDGDDRVFHYLPFCFAGSRIVLWTCMFRNNPIWMSTDLNNLKEEFISARPHYFLNVPALLERIKNGVETKLRANTPVWKIYQAGREAYLRDAVGRGRKRDGLLLALARTVVFRKIRQGIGADLECLICGSAPLGDDTQRWFEMLGIPVYQVYGLTETTAIVTMDEPRQGVPGRVGHVIEGVEVKLSEEGELLIKGPNIFEGYWKRPDATKEAFVADPEDGGRWFRTGDAAEVDRLGNWRIIGRTGNILVPSSGHNIAPEPMEQKLLEGIVGAEHAVVFGHGRAFLTAVISGAVKTPEVKQAIDALNAELPHYRRVRQHFVTEEAFTPENGLLTANQKLKRRALEKHFKSELDRMYQ